jgi:DNA-binding NarL/FixJ family response regulator
MPADLQPKDIQLLQALADGKKFKQIGEEMGTSEQCAKEPLQEAVRDIACRQWAECSSDGAETRAD